MAAETSDSSLSPAPEDLQTETIKAATNGRKRKAESTAKTTVKTKRTKASTGEAQEENEVTENAETPRKKRATAKKVQYQVDTNDNVEAVNGEQATTIEKTTKKKVTRTKKSKEPVPPLEQRTTDTKLRIGAHVSVAGG